MAAYLYNMHARRYFVKALDAGDQRAALPLAAYKRLYKIEDEIRNLDDDAKLAARQARSKPVWDELAKWCALRKQHEPPASKLGVALRYFTNHHSALARFLDYGFLPLDNGIVERLHVRTALTRKNILFAGSDAGGERAAIAYTILGSCRLVGVDPREYLADVLPRLTGRIRLVDLPSLLPSRWALKRGQTFRQPLGRTLTRASRRRRHFGASAAGGERGEASGGGKRPRRREASGAPPSGAGRQLGLGEQPGCPASGLGGDERRTAGSSSGKRIPLGESARSLRQSFAITYGIQRSPAARSGI